MLTEFIYWKKEKWSKQAITKNYWKKKDCIMQCGASKLVKEKN